MKAFFAFFPFRVAIKYVDVGSGNEFHMNPKTNTPHFKSLFPDAPVNDFYINELAQTKGFDEAELYYHERLDEMSQV